MKFYLDNRVGAHNVDDEFYGLDQSGVVNLLGKLNGERHTLLCVKREDGWVLFIGGGSEKFLVNKVSPEDISYEVKSDMPGGNIELCVGGQYGEYESSSLASYDLARMALLDFCEFSSLEKYTWSVVE
ncbi:hypothetical protein JH314_09215 [Xanthomonas campestris]|uniref:hypothetical protein n=1 Tax=Xanthomonas TaxID=338 RepID=UPI001055EFB6|nr:MULTISPECIES: hypothetical protein [Xanthomonas]WDJ03554.1 hypothetical protein JH314_09215 [Xanthomonas campestris]WVL62507.1 hypothetical protein LLE68_009335 [Xanthomonas campestris pv. barbareae]